MIDRQSLMATFLAETEENLAALEEGLIALERRPEDAEALASVFRQAHTLKGNAATLGFDGLAAFAHAIEDLLDRVRSRAVTVAPGLVSLLLESLDGLRDMVARIAGDSDEDMDPPAPLIERLARAAASGDAGRPRGASERKGRGRTRGRPEAASSVPTVPKRAPDPPEADPAAEAPGASPRREGAQARSLRVSLARLDRMLNLAGEIAVARGRLRQMVDARASSEDLREAVLGTDRLFEDLQEEILKVRMVPIGPVFRRHLRTVRDAAAASDKQARLVMRGEEVEVDTSVVERLGDPLLHLVRNAIDHGIEPPEVRAAQGKDPCGTVTLSARHEGGGLVIEVGDDGAGLSRDRILERARARRLVANDEALADDAVYDLIFEAGLSTAARVTELSGRGVGLDVVRRHVVGLRGSVRVDSRPGLGATFTLRLPLSLSIIPGFAVGVEGETYVVPMEAVLECLDLPEGAGRDAGDSGVLNVRGEGVPYLRLRRHFGLGGKPPARESVVLVRDARLRAGLAVDRLLGESQAVVKPLGRLFTGVAGLAGSTILGDGRVALILDVPALLRAGTEKHLGRRPPDGPARFLEA